MRTLPSTRTDAEVSVVRDLANKELRIFTEPGRAMRPLLIVDYESHRFSRHDPANCSAANCSAASCAAMVFAIAKICVQFGQLGHKWHFYLFQIIRRREIERFLSSFVSRLLIKKRHVWALQDEDREPRCAFCLNYALQRSNHTIQTTKFRAA